MALCTSYDDMHLLSLLKTGDEAAFRELYDRYWDRLFTLAANKLRSPEEAEEIVQDIFLDIWNRRNELKITSSFSAYLAVAVKYKVINYLVKRKNFEEYKLDNKLNIEADLSTEQWLSFEELKERLAKHVADLPEKCRMVFQMSRDLGLSQKEIASKTGIAEKTVEAHISKALKVLHSSLRSLFPFFF